MSRICTNLASSNQHFISGAHRRQAHSIERIAGPMSALPPKADMDQHGRDVRFVPKADIQLLRSILGELIYVNAVVRSLTWSVVAQEAD